MKIQINSKKPGFGRKNQLRMWKHLGQWHMPTLIHIIEPPAFNPEFQHFTCIFNKSSLLYRDNCVERSKEEFRNERRALVNISNTFFNCWAKELIL
jgi:hypothetical protein